MKTAIIVLMNLSIYGTTTAQVSSERELLVEFLSSEFETMSDKKFIPGLFLKQINQGKKAKLVFANPDESYNSTDMWIKGEPNARLIAFGKSENDLFVLIYDVGGYVVSREAYIFKNIQKRFVLEHFVLDSSIGKIEDLKKFIDKKS